MKTWSQSGDTVTVVAPADINSGEGLMIGVLFGVAVSTATSGSDLEICTTGVVDLPKASGAITQGAKVYWDNTAKVVTTTATSNTLIGCAIVAAAVGDAAVGDATARVRLNGVVV
ncbi:MAG: DUF2190 family protein [Nitrospirae bacterium]|nr:DUF2190 family protein [Magnetococcales bacterium]HAT48866.1 hypothetical protein [Alphaproteobacteria bacterium]